MGDHISKQGAMYRPASHETWKRIQRIMHEQEMSWNAAVNFLVLQGLRVVESTPARNEGRRY